MTRFHSTALLICLALAGAGCGDWYSNPDGFTEDDLRIIRTMVLNRAPMDPRNEFSGNADVIELGQKLFFDQGFAMRSTDKAVSCASCHSPKLWFSDPNRTSLSVGVSTPTGRNSPSLVNVGHYNSWGWDGRADSIWVQAIHAFESPRTMAGNPVIAWQRVRAVYAAQFDAAFVTGLPGGAPATIASLSPDQAYPFILKAWGAYIASLDSRRSPFDLWASGEDLDALTEGQKRGLKLFIGKAGCVECHTGPTFSDGDFHNVGIGQVGDGLPQFDYGLWDGLGALAAVGSRDAGAPDVLPTGFLVTAPRVRVEADRGRFRTKSLRQVAETGPYFHGGQLKTLKDVVWFYNQGGDHAGFGTVSSFMVPLGMSDEEQADLVSFLESLTGSPIPVAQGCDNSQNALREVLWWGAPQFTSATVTEPEGGFAVRSDAGEALLLPDAGVLFRSKDGYVNFGTTADGGPRTAWVEPFARDFPCPPDAGGP